MAFIDELRAASGKHPIAESRVCRLIQSGRISRDSIRLFAAAAVAGATHFMSHLARVYRITPNPEVKLALLENLLEEEGVHIKPHGLDIRPSSRHVTWARRFSDAAGTSQAQLDQAMIDFRRPELDALIEQGDWLGALAYLTLGLEANTPHTFVPILEGLKKMGFSDSELVFFSNHITLDMQHGDEAFELVAAVTPQARQQDVLDAVEAGADFWWRIHSVS